MLKLTTQEEFLTYAFVRIRDKSPQVLIGQPAMERIECLFAAFHNHDTFRMNHFWESHLEYLVIPQYHARGAYSVVQCSEALVRLYCKAMADVILSETDEIELIDFIPMVLDAADLLDGVVLDETDGRFTIISYASFDDRYQIDINVAVRRDDVGCTADQQLHS